MIKSPLLLPVDFSGGLDDLDDLGVGVVEQLMSLVQGVVLGVDGVVVSPAPRQICVATNHWLKLIP